VLPTARPVPQFSNNTGYQTAHLVRAGPEVRSSFAPAVSPRLVRTVILSLTYNDESVWAGVALLNGLPATTMPVGRTEDGLPIGMQIIGNYLDDRTAIAFAGLVDREIGGFTPPPHL
jgi:amidase